MLYTNLLDLSTSWLAAVIAFLEALFAPCDSGEYGR